jgi:hypothetical protein
MVFCKRYKFFFSLFYLNGNEKVEDVERYNKNRWMVCQIYLTPPLYRPIGLCITINKLRKYKIAIAAIQETRWNKSHKPLRAIDITNLPAALPIIMNLEQLS